MSHTRGEHQHHPPGISGPDCKACDDIVPGLVFCHGGEHVRVIVPVEVPKVRRLPVRAGAARTPPPPEDPPGEPRASGRADGKMYSLSKTVFPLRGCCEAIPVLCREGLHHLGECSCRGVVALIHHHETEGGTLLLGYAPLQCLNHPESYRGHPSLFPAPITPASIPRRALTFSCHW